MFAGRVRAPALIMITCYFAPPGAGKTCVLSLIASNELKRIRSFKSPYKRIYTNFPLRGCYRISVADLGTYYIRDSLILLDEVTLELDSRDWKNVQRGLVQFITLHRHLNNDIIYAVQDWSRAEKTLRENTVALYYLYRSPAPFFSRFCHAKKIFRNLDINEHKSELVLGYRFSDFFDRLFSRCDQVFYLPRAYKLFDSWDEYGLNNRPKKRLINWFPPLAGGRAEDYFLVMKKNKKIRVSDALKVLKDDDPASLPQMVESLNKVLFKMGLPLLPLPDDEHQSDGLS